MSIASNFPPRLDLELLAGDANRFELQLLTAGTDMDLTGAVIQAQCRERATAEEVLISASFEIVDAGRGMVVMTWDGDEVRDALDGEADLKAVWDLQIELAGDTMPTTVAAGKVTMRLDVTR